MIALEICVDSMAGLDSALSGGADRIELCAALPLGGLTPSTGFMRQAAHRAGPIPVFAMIRPRAGDFRIGDDELAIMRTDIGEAAAAGLRGVVFGAATDDARLDRYALDVLCGHARECGLEATLHRVADLTPDLADTTRIAVACGFQRMLTGGGARRASEGIAALRQAFDVAAGTGLAVMPGGGVTPETAALLCASLPLREIHASASVIQDGPPDPFAPGLVERRTCAAQVRAIKTALPA